MRLATAILICSLASVCVAQTDSMVVQLTSGSLRTYSLPAIVQLSFKGAATTGAERDRMQSILTAFALHQNYPNPFNPSTTIEYTIPHMGRVDVRIFDISGRVVRSLLADEQSAGLHRIVWDGRNGHGQAVASGVYYCQVRFAEALLVKKLVLVK